MEADDERSGSIAWTFTGDGTLQGAPVIVAGHAYVGSNTGAIYAVRLADGDEAWRDEPGGQVGRYGLAAAPPAAHLDGRSDHLCRVRGGSRGACDESPIANRTAASG